MTESCSTECTARRPLGGVHLPGCPLASPDVKVVSIYRNGDTGRPVAVPDEVVTEAEREYRAYKLHARGKNWSEIAIEEMYPSASAAAAAVKRYLDEGRAVVQDFTRKEVIAAYVGRLEMYRAALWGPAVDEGKISAMMALLSVEDRWVKAFGLDTPDAEGATVQTVVVPTDDYLEQLRLADREDSTDTG